MLKITVSLRQYVFMMAAFNRLMNRNRIGIPTEIQVNIHHRVGREALTDVLPSNSHRLRTCSSNSSELKASPGIRSMSSDFNAAFGSLVGPPVAADESKAAGSVATEPVDASTEFAGKCAAEDDTGVAYCDSNASLTSGDSRESSCKTQAKVSRPRISIHKLENLPH